LKYLVIVNPISGRGRGERLLPIIKDNLHQYGLNFEIVSTKNQWHAANLARQASIDGYEVIVGAGGDGTVNEIINGIMSASTFGVKQPALGILGIGTGNDFAASMGVSTRLDEACHCLSEDRRRIIDVGIVKEGKSANGRYFGNCVGIGFDAAGTIQSYKITWASGDLAYLIAALQTIFVYFKAPTLKIQYDDQAHTIQALMVSIMNGRRIGGRFWTAPESQSDDGVFDLCIAKLVSRVRMFSLIPHFMKGTQSTQSEILMAQARKVRISAIKGTMPVQVDGEILCESGVELDIDILPLQLEIVGLDKTL